MKNLVILVLMGFIVAFMGCDSTSFHEEPIIDETSYEVDLREEVDSIKIGEIEDDGSLTFTVSKDTLADVAKTVLYADEAHSVELQEIDSSGVNVGYHLLTSVEYKSGSTIDSSKIFSITLIAAQVDGTPNTDVVLGKDECSQECTSERPCNGCDLDKWSDCSGKCVCISTSDNSFPSDAHCNHKVAGISSPSQFVEEYIEELAIRDI